MIAQEKTVFQKTDREKAGSRRTAREKEALAKNALLTENQARGPVGSVTATSHSSVTGRVPGHSVKVIELAYIFQKGNSFFGNFFPQLH